MDSTPLWTAVFGMACDTSEVAIDFSRRQQALDLKSPAANNSIREDRRASNRSSTDSKEVR
jgi:hypothetical protein